MKHHGSALFQYFILFLFLALGIFFLDKAHLIDDARAFLEKAVFSKTSEKTSLSQEEIQNFKAKIATLERKVDSLQKENVLLRKQLQAPLPPTYKFTPVEVISFKNSKEKKRALTVFSGRETDLKSGESVVLEEVMIGRVGKVGATVSEVVLLSDKDSKIAAKTGNNAKGLIVGGDDDFKIVYLTHILQKEKVEVGETVVTSGEDGLLPDILIGKIDEVISHDQEPYKKAKVSLFADPSKLLEIFIVKI